MGIKIRITIMNFLQFFIWGAWLITIGGYWFQNRHWTGTDFGVIFSTMGIASLFMPAIAGIIADRWINAEKLLGIFHIMGAAVLFILPKVNDPTTFFWVMLLNMVFYMPTISLAITVAYSALKGAGLDVIKSYPPIRVFGTIGFIVAMWTVSLLKFETSAMQFYVASGASLTLGVFSFSLPKCTVNKNVRSKNLVDMLGLKAFTLFKNPKMAMFFIFSMMLGASLQLTNAYGDTFLHDFSKVPKYADLISIYEKITIPNLHEIIGFFNKISYLMGVENLIPMLVLKYPAIIMSISQMSETLFILAIPFFLLRFGIKKVMLISMVAWVLRFALFGFGNPAEALWMIILSNIIYGMAFDFFNISGSLFVETQTDSSIRASAQGVFMMMTNGFGAILGSWSSGLMIDHYFKDAAGNFEWQGIGLTFAAYSLVVAILFAFLFRHKHHPNEVAVLNH